MFSEIISATLNMEPYFCLGLFFDYLCGRKADCLFVCLLACLLARLLACLLACFVWPRSGSFRAFTVEESLCSLSCRSLADFDVRVTAAAQLSARFHTTRLCNPFGVASFCESKKSQETGGGGRNFSGNPLVATLLKPPNSPTSPTSA